MRITKDNNGKPIVNFEVPKVDIKITALDFATCSVFRLPDTYDFQVFCTDGEYDWRGVCFRKDLQRCVELGISAFA